MRKGKWLIPVVVVSVLVVGGIVGGLVVAADNSTGSTQDQSQPSDRYQTLLDRACTIYEEETGVAIDSEQLKAALAQARQEMQDEALEDWLQKLVEKGKITQEQADQYLQWWRSRPKIELPLPGPWRHGPRGGMMWGRCFGPWGDPACAPAIGGERNDRE